MINQPKPQSTRKIAKFFKIISKIVLLLVGLLLLLVVILYVYLTAPRQPKHLSNQTEVIDVYYVNWACDCANFYVIRANDDGQDGRDVVNKDDYIFIEPASDKLKIDEDDLHRKSADYTLRLTGQYYVDEGVPDSYERKIFADIPRIDSAKVFRYEAYQYVQKENARNR